MKPVWIIDDDRSIRWVFEKALTRENIAYRTFSSAAEALTALKELEEKYARREAPGQHLAGVYAGLGEKDQAFARLERDFEERSGSLPSITFSLWFEDLRGDARYADLVRRMGLNP